MVDGTIDQPTCTKELANGRKCGGCFEWFKTVGGGATWECKECNKRNKRNRARRERDEAMRSIGLVKVKSASGRTYWE